MNNLTPAQKRAKEDYEDAQRKKRMEERKQDSYQTNLRNSLDSIHSNNSKKRNLEKRLEQIKKIINTMDKLDRDYFDKLNRSASNADATYGTTVVCKGINRGNIKKSFFTKSMNEDAGTNSAYLACLAEKSQIEATIDEIDRQIRSLNSKIDVLQSNIRNCQNAISAAETQMRKSKRAMN